jgi:hypothetical protein
MKAQTQHIQSQLCMDGIGQLQAPGTFSQRTKPQQPTNKRLVCPRAAAKITLPVLAKQWTMIILSVDCRPVFLNQDPAEHRQGSARKRRISKNFEVTQRIPNIPRNTKGNSCPGNGNSGVISAPHQIFFFPFSQVGVPRDTKNY